MPSVEKLTRQGVRAYRQNARSSLPYFRQALKLGTKQRAELTTEAFDDLVYNLACTLGEVEELPEAIGLYSELPWTHHVGQFALALALLKVGRFEDGLARYHHRYLGESFGSPKFPALPLPFLEPDAALGTTSQFGDLTGMSLLVLNEQGFGDELMFSRSLPRLAGAVRHAHVQVYPEQLQLFQEQFRLPNVRFFAERSFGMEFVRQFDAYTCTGNVWVQFPFEPAPQFDAAPHGLDRTRRHVGICCSPNGSSKNSALRAVDPRDLARLAGPGTVLHNLSTGGAHPFAVDHRAELRSFSDTLRWVRSMDLVLTCDTALAHLAACAGVPTAVVHRQYLDWRWTSGLYPSVRTVGSGDLGEFARP